MRHTAAAAVAFGLFISANNFALAAEPAYVGTWGTDAAQCSVPQDQQGAPMAISAAGYDQHEAHCEFKTVSGQAPTWKVSALCSVEGDRQEAAFTLTVDGNQLMVADAYGSQTLMKCE
ncbi:MAG: hypothetical protein KJ622_08870 [Alphaproteobacteria bacterium]|nr:hypothetical protein [Alphaproteobacteria bacterium]